MLLKTSWIWPPIFDHLISRGWAEPAGLRSVAIAPHGVVEVVVRKRKPTWTRQKPSRKIKSASSEKEFHPRARASNFSSSGRVLKFAIPAHQVKPLEKDPKTVCDRGNTSNRGIKKSVSNLSPLGPGLERGEHAPRTPPPSGRAWI
jgi:hypothetical protein